METATTKALARLAERHDGCSDYRLAKLLGVSTAAVSMYRSGQRQLDDHLAVKIAEMADLPPAQLLAEIAAERSKDAGARAHWLRLAKMARAACVVAAILAGVALHQDIAPISGNHKVSTSLQALSGGAKEVFNASNWQGLPAVIHVPPSDPTGLVLGIALLLYALWGRRKPKGEIAQ